MLWRYKRWETLPSWTVTILSFQIFAMMRWELRGKNKLIWWHHWLNGNEFGWTLEVGDGQLGLACCSSWGSRESDMSEWIELSWAETKKIQKPPSMSIAVQILCESRSVVSHSLWPHGLCSLWNSPGQNTGVGSLSFLQWIQKGQNFKLMSHCLWRRHRFPPTPSRMTVYNL